MKKFASLCLGIVVVSIVSAFMDDFFFNKELGYPYSELCFVSKNFY